MMYRGVPGTGTPLITDLDEPPATGPIVGYSHQAIANLYTYAQNNPINRVDPSGLESIVLGPNGEEVSWSTAPEAAWKATFGFLEPSDFRDLWEWRYLYEQELARVSGTDEEFRKLADVEFRHLFDQHYESEFMGRVFSEYGVDPVWTRRLDIRLKQLRNRNNKIGGRRIPSDFIALGLLSWAGQIESIGLFHAQSVAGPPPPPRPWLPTPKAGRTRVPQPKQQTVRTEEQLPEFEALGKRLEAEASTTSTSGAPNTTPATPTPGRMHVEPVTLRAGETGRDFVIPGRSTPETFSARLMDASKTLEVTWTESLGEGAIAGRLAKAQELAGGPGSFTRITGKASDNLQRLIASNKFDAKQASQVLSQRLGGRWQVEVTRRPNSTTWDIIATRIGD